MRTGNWTCRVAADITMLNRARMQGNTDRSAAQDAVVRASARVALGETPFQA